MSKIILRCTVNKTKKKIYFSKSLPQNFMKIISVESELLRADGERHTHTDINLRTLSNFSKLCRSAQ